jgi:hypothetical protein
MKTNTQRHYIYGDHTPKSLYDAMSARMQLYFFLIL